MVSIERSFIVFNVFHRLVVHTFAVSTVTTALLTNTQYVRNAIGRQTFLCRFIYNREQIYSISDRIWDQTEKEREKKGEREKKTWGKKEQKKKKCRRQRQSYKHQNHCPVYSYFSSNLCVYWQRSETKLCKINIRFLNGGELFEISRRENKIYVTHRFTSICIHEFVSLVYFWGKKMYSMQNRSRIPNGFSFFFPTIDSKYFDLLYYLYSVY